MDATRGFQDSAYHPAPVAGRRPLASPRLAARNEACRDIRYRFVVRLVAFAAQVPVAEMLASARGSVEVARARQIAMYLLHTKLSLPFAAVANCFGRDRTTVAHACAAVEDLRDIPERDDFVGELESMLELALSMAPDGAEARRHGQAE